jgi:peptidoglycan/LPS O-acetylase OafA/YrhL
MNHRFQVLDIFRGIFASMIVLFHLRAFTDSPLISNLFVSNADVFVDFFFVLSGFVITYSYGNLSDNDQLTSFFKKRVLRIYPLHLILLLAFVFIETFKNYLGGFIHINQPDNPNNNIYSFLTNLFLFNSVKLFNITDLTWNLPSWSISAEMISYLVFGIGIFLLSKLGIISKRVFFYLGMIAVCGISIVLITGHVQFQYTFDYGFLRGLIGFFTGALCYYTFDRSKDLLYRLPTVVFHVLEIAMVSLIPIIVCCGDVFRPFGYVYEVAFFISVLVFSVERGFVSTLLQKSTFLKKAGKYSYSIYMTHALLLSLFNIVFIRILKFPPSAYTYLFFLNYYLIFKVSEWTYKHIEMRFARSSVKGQSGGKRRESSFLPLGRKEVVRHDHSI